MADLVVIVPSRGRPEATIALARAFADTCTAGTALSIAIDADDPRRNDYHDGLRGLPSVSHIIEQPSGTMVTALNFAADMASKDAFAVGFMGDDHCPRTHGWDQAYLDALKDLGTGIVYGNDLLQGGSLPTQVAMTSDIVRALGYMAPPALRHMYVDNFWLSLGRAADCIRYLPDVIVEHRHPLAGKAQWDEGYMRVNDRAVYRADEQAFAEYVRTQLADDAAKVRALRG
jgi:hypothetical protein